MIKLSIITINYNNVTDLLKTIKSVFEQTWKDFEYIIIDGGSTDGSVEEIIKNQKYFTYWESEPDNGVFHAMNKGIRKATGEYLLMLNSGDFLSDNEVLERVFASNLYNDQILAGDVYRIKNGEIFQRSIFPEVLSFNFFIKGSLSHQGTFIKRELHHLVGMYDETLKFSSDWKFFVLAMFKYKVSYKHLPFFIAVCDCGGITNRPKNFSQMNEEGELVLSQYFPDFFTEYKNHKRRQNRTLKRQIIAAKQHIKTYLKKVIKLAQL